MFLLKANDALDEECYEDALADFEQALVLLAKEGVRPPYYPMALSDKAFVQCFLAQYEAVLVTVERAHRALQSSMHRLSDNRGAILVLAGAYADALNILSERLNEAPEDEHLRFTLATCLLHMERYQEAIEAYEQALAEDSSLPREGLEAARLGRQPDWANL